MTEELHFSIPGKPQTKLRPRFSKFKGRVKTYNAQSSENTTMKWQFKARMGEIKPLDGPLVLDMKFFMPIPKSASKKKKEMMLSGELKYVKTPDCDNLVKMYLDCMNGVVYRDDKQIYKLTAIKQYDAIPRTEITVWEESNQDKDSENGKLLKV